MKCLNSIKVLSILILLVMFISCEQERPLETVSQNIDPGGAQSVDVELRMGAGELELRGGASTLMEAVFSFNRRRIEPEVDYRVINNKGILSVHQKRRSSFFIGHTHNNWDIRLNNTIPLELEVNLGAGQSHIDLNGMDVRNLNVHIGVGEMELNLAGIHPHDLNVSVNGGIGSGTVNLPADIGVQVEVDGGIGSVHADGLIKKGAYYTNEAYGKTAARIILRIKAGIGSIDLRVSGVRGVSL